MVTKVSHELELKFELHPDKISGGRRIPRLLGKDLGGPQRVEELESLYFDTPGRRAPRKWRIAADSAGRKAKRADDQVAQTFRLVRPRAIRNGNQRQAAAPPLSRC